MSTTEHEQPQTDPRMISRAFVTTDLSVAGRTVDVRVVPFGEVATVADPPDFRPYEEQWMPGCFDHQVRAANHIRAKVDHSDQLINTCGHGLSLRSEPDGYHASFEMHETQAGETALALLRAGSLPAVSLEAIPKRNVRAGRILQRVRADLYAVAFVRKGAFQGAQVLAVREELEDAITIDAELLPYDMDPELVQRLQARNIALPSRYTAHPDDQAPPETGTPDEGTRQEENDPQLLED